MAGARFNRQPSNTNSAFAAAANLLLRGAQVKAGATIGAINSVVGGVRRREEINRQDVEIAKRDKRQKEQDALSRDRNAFRDNLALNADRRAEKSLEANLRESDARLAKAKVLERTRRANMDRIKELAQAKLEGREPDLGAVKKKHGPYADLAENDTAVQALNRDISEQDPLSVMVELRSIEDDIKFAEKNDDGTLETKATLKVLRHRSGELKLQLQNIGNARKDVAARRFKSDQVESTTRLVDKGIKDLPGMTQEERVAVLREWRDFANTVPHGTEAEQLDAKAKDHIAMVRRQAEDREKAREAEKKAAIEVKKAEIKEAKRRRDVAESRVVSAENAKKSEAASERKAQKAKEERKTEVAIKSISEKIERARKDAEEKNKEIQEHNSSVAVFGGAIRDEVSPLPDLSNFTQEQLAAAAAELGHGAKEAIISAMTKAAIAESGLESEVKDTLISKRRPAKSEGFNTVEEVIEAFRESKGREPTKKQIDTWRKALAR